MCTARDSNSLAALSAIVAFVLLFEEPALLAATIASKRQLQDYPSEPFFASKVPTHDLPLYLLAAFFSLVNVWFLEEPFSQLKPFPS